MCTGAPDPARRRFRRCWACSRKAACAWGRQSVPCSRAWSSDCAAMWALLQERLSRLCARAAAALQQRAATRPRPPSRLSGKATSLAPAPAAAAWVRWQDAVDAATVPDAVLTALAAAVAGKQLRGAHSLLAHTAPPPPGQAKMDEGFQRALVGPSDPGYEYDRPLHVAAPVAASEWDEDE